MKKQEFAEGLDFREFDTQWVKLCACVCINIIMSRHFTWNLYSYYLFKIFTIISAHSYQPCCSLLSFFFVLAMNLKTHVFRFIARDFFFTEGVKGNPSCEKPIVKVFEFYVLMQCPDVFNCLMICPLSRKKLSFWRTVTLKIFRLKIKKTIWLDFSL